MPPAKKAKSATSDPLLPLLTDIVRALDDKKAADVRVLRVSAQSSITDYLVLATGNSDPHLRALRVEMEKVLDGAGSRIAGMETSDGSGWTVVDAYQIMVHLFTPDKRDAYQLERLWKDAEDIPVAGLLGKPKPAAKPRAPRKTAAKAGTSKPAKKKTAASKKAPARKKKD